MCAEFEAILLSIPICCTHTPLCVTRQNLPLILSLLSSVTEHLYRKKNPVLLGSLSLSLLPLSDQSIKNGVCLYIIYLFIYFTVLVKTEHLVHFKTCFVQSSLIICISESKNSPKVKVFSPSSL